MGALVLAGSVCGSPAQETDLAIHDPSTLLLREHTYWVFGTGPGCPAFSSTDRVHWTPAGNVFAAPPDWIKDAVPGNTRNFLWAPDVRKIGDKYCLYYAVSTFGSNVSAIGLATSSTLALGTWTDQGIVIRSQVRSNFNAIDPAIFQAPDGRLWLSFGSFWSGIKMIELDPATGKRIAPASPIYPLAAHPQEKNDAIEAPFLYYHKGFYYLFVNWDYCCRRSKSTYNIRVGRSLNVIGPYMDAQGTPLLKGGGTLLLASGSEGSAEATAKAKIGPGHAGILDDNGVERFSFHYEYVPEGNGRSKLEVGTVQWTPEGWPKIILPQ